MITYDGVLGDVYSFFKFISHLKGSSLEHEESREGRKEA